MLNLLIFAHFGKMWVQNYIGFSKHANFFDCFLLNSTKMKDLKELKDVAAAFDGLGNQRTTALEFAILAELVQTALVAFSSHLAASESR